jgi:hypothetical protein
MSSSSNRVGQVDLVSSCFTTIVQILNQVYTQGHAREEHVKALGPSIISSCYNAIQNPSDTQLFWLAYEREKVANPAINNIMTGWIESMQHSTLALSDHRRQDVNVIMSALFNSFSTELDPFIRKNNSIDAIMDETFRLALKAYGGYFSELEAEFPEYSEYLATILQVLASSLVLCVSDRVKSNLSDDQKGEWLAVMGFVQSTICGWTASQLDGDTVI